MIGLYVHIPFCGKICNYCDFVKFKPKNVDIIDQYVNRLIENFFEYSSYFDEIRTIFIGGGTPNYLDDKNLEKILRTLSKNLKNIKEFSIEINPEYFTENQAKLFKKYNVNRVSIGVQTFDNRLLENINRGHKEEDVYIAVEILKKYGLNNYSFDLMYGFENQTFKMVKTDLKKALKLKPKHISYYSFIMEKNTFFYHKFIRDSYEIMDEDLNYKITKFIKNKLKLKKYINYEISNYAKKNYFSIHNSLYWEFENYIGIGLGASGFLNGIRIKNERVLSKYLNNFVYYNHKLKEEELLSENMIMGLRLLKGLNLDIINKRYNINVLDKYPKIKEFIEYKLLKLKKGNLRLTKKGYYLANLVYEIFV